MNKAQYILSVRSWYDGGHGVWVVQFDNELYKVHRDEASTTVEILFTGEKITDKELIVSIEAVMATRVFEMMEEREKAFAARKSV